MLLINSILFADLVKLVRNGQLFVSSGDPGDLVEPFDYPSTTPCTT